MIFSSDSVVFEQLMVNDKKRRYFELTKNNNVFFDKKEQQIISIFGRSKNDSKINKYFYQLELFEDDKQECIIIDFYSNKDNNSKKSKIYQIQSKNKLSQFSIKLTKNTNPVYLRILKNTPYE